MTSQEHYQIRLNLIDLVTQYLQDTYAGCTEDQGQDGVFRLLRIYRTDTVRRMEGRAGTLEYLWLELKVGVRLAGAIMDDVRATKSQSLIGWYHGCTPQNMVQAFYNLVSATVLELTKSIVEIEERHPEQKQIFALERKSYAKLCNALEN